VLGHEIGHVDAKHSVDQYSKQMLAGSALAGASVLAPKWQAAFGAGGMAAQLAFLKFGRDAELEADRLGVGYASSGGWAPQAMQGVLGTLGRLDEAQGSRRGVPNWALTHPPAADRVAKVQESVAAAAARGGTATNASEFDRVIDRIVVGDSREKGMVRGSDFIHPILRFSVRFPQGWTIMNGSDQVSAVESEQGNVAMVLEFSKNAAGSVAQIARTEMLDAGLRETSGASTRVNGLEAYVGTYEGVSGSTTVLLRVAHIRAAQRVYLVAGMTTAAEFPRVDGSFAAAIQTFRELSPAEAEQIQPSRLGFQVVRPGDTWESIARQTRNGSSVKPATLAIMNGSDAATPPRAGGRIRVVIGG
jgi:predicted Zn-dependent protease